MKKIDGAKKNDKKCYSIWSDFMHSNYDTIFYNR